VPAHLKGNHKGGATTRVCPYTEILEEKMTQTFIALLRGINVSGRNKILMADLRSLCADLGWQHVQSYIQSGNLLFEADATAATLESELEQAIEQTFGLSIPVIVRETAVWSAYVNDNPYPQASQTEPNRVMLALSKLPPETDAVTGLQPYAVNGERIRQVGDALWIHYANGSGRSKMSPAVLDRLVGSPVTTRNWRTVLKLNELIQSHPGEK
jgi:uncharacterized protein (DUF1697 family)